MKTLNILILGLSLTLAACNSDSSPVASSGAIQAVTFQAVTPSPTPTSLPLTIPQKITKLQLNNPLAVTGADGIQTVMPVTASSQKIINVTINNPDMANSQTSIWATISALNITQGELNQSGTYYLTAQGTIKIVMSSGTLIPDQYLNIPQGTFYFNLSNIAIGPWGATPVGINGLPFAIAPTSNIVTKSCGLLELYSDALMTHQIAVLGNHLDCGQI